MFGKIMLAFVLMHSSVALAAEKAREPPKQVLIKNVYIFDGKNEKLKTNMSVLVEANLIKKIGKDLSI